MRERRRRTIISFSFSFSFFFCCFEVEGEVTDEFLDDFEVGEVDGEEVGGELVIFFASLKRRKRRKKGEK